MRPFALSLILFLMVSGTAAGRSVQADSLKLELTFDVDSTGLPIRRVFDAAICKDSVFLVISKIHQEHISVYEKRRRDTVLLAAYPCCLSAIRGQKKHEGDCRTPESWPGKPFRIWRISDLRKLNERKSDFRMFGPYYHALAIPGVGGVGIHGTNNPRSIALGRRSHGCIRMLNQDVTHLVDNYSQVGMHVIILPEEKAPLPFEERALRLVCGLDEDSCNPGCGPGCYVANRPCHRIHYNSFMLRKAIVGL